MGVTYRPGGIPEKSSVYTGDYNNNTSKLNSGGVYFLSAKEGSINTGDSTLKINNNQNNNLIKADQSKRILSVLLPKVPINLLCQRRYIREGIFHEISSSCEPNIRNMGKRIDVRSLYNDGDKDRLFESINNASGICYEFILTDTINDN